MTQLGEIVQTPIFIVGSTDSPCTDTSYVVSINSNGRNMIHFIDVRCISVAPTTEKERAICNTKVEFQVEDVGFALNRHQ